MAEPISIQQLKNASEDAISLAEFIYKPADFMVARRLAPTINTLQYYINRFNSLNGDFSSSVSVALSSLNSSVAEAVGKVAYIETTVQDAINNTAVEGGVLADTFVTVTGIGTGAIARTQRDKNSDVLSVKDFGAKGDGVTDDSLAIQNAIIAALKRTSDPYATNKSIYFPIGKYLIKQDNLLAGYVFNDYGIANVAKLGLRFYGEGIHSSQLVLDTSDGNSKWFFNNFDAPAEKRVMYADTTFENLTITTNNTELGHGFKQWSEGQDKRFKFINCNINLGVVLQTEGTGNSDLNYFVNCYISASTAVLVLNNQQSVANRLINCDVAVYRDFVRIFRGGSFWMNGGNLEMHNKSGVDVEDHYLFNFTPNLTSGRGNAEFTMRDVRIEIHGANKKLVVTPESDIGQRNITFTEVEVGTSLGGLREGVVAGIGTHVYFNNCILPRDTSYKAIGAIGGSPFGSLIRFNACEVDVNQVLHKLCSRQGSASRIISNGCYSVTGGVTRYSNFTHDFDFGWHNRSAYAVLPTVKIIPLFHTTDPFPNVGTGNTIRTSLPENAYIKKIHIGKRAIAGAAGAEYQLHVGYADKSNTLLSTDIVKFSAATSATILDVGILPTTTLALWSTGTEGHAITSIGNLMVGYIEYI